MGLETKNQTAHGSAGLWTMRDQPGKVGNPLSGHVQWRGADTGPQPNMVPITEAESAAEPTGLMLTEDTRATLYLLPLEPQ